MSFLSSQVMEKHELGPYLVCTNEPQITQHVLFGATPNKFCCVCDELSRKKVIVYLDKLDKARFNERNTRVTFVSRGDTIKVVGGRKEKLQTNRFFLLPHASP